MRDLLLGLILWLNLLIRDRVRFCGGLPELLGSWDNAHRYEGTILDTSRESRLSCHYQEAFDFGRCRRREDMLNASIAAKRAELYASYSFRFSYWTA
jgi:hypothetical protein